MEEMTFFESHANFRNAAPLFSSAIQPILPQVFSNKKKKAENPNCPFLKKTAMTFLLRFKVFSL